MRDLSTDIMEMVTSEMPGLEVTRVYYQGNNKIHLQRTHGLNCGTYMGLNA